MSTTRREDDGAETQAQAARSHFDHEAAVYETGNRYRRLWQPRNEAIDLLELTSDDRLLDLGCGTGETLRRLGPLVSRAVGADISPAMIEQARSQAQGQTNLEFAVAEAGRLPFADETFSAILCTFSFHHYPRPAEAAREIARVLKHGGRLVLADANSDLWTIKLADLVARRREPGHVHFCSSKELTLLLSGAGLTQIAIRPHRSWYLIATAVKPAA
jgi:ubiquinone/menaquinone biosynthesis C-methylase UbiE